jgi:hypothetical protein
MNKMNKDRAYENVRILGNNFALSMADIGKNIDDKSPLMNGLAAYEMLNLKGVYDWLDTSIEIVMRDVFELARERVMAA